MDQTTHKQEKKPKLNVGFGIGLGEYSSSVIIGMISGIATAGATIRAKFFDDIKHAEDFAEHWSKHAQGLKKVAVVAKDPEHPTAAESKDFAKRIRKAKKDWGDILDKKILSDRGVSKSLIVGTLERAQLMGDRSIKAIIVNSVAGIAVGAVVTLGFFNGIATRAKINAIDNAVEPDNDQPPEQRALAYKDRDPLETHVNATAAKNDADIKHADKIVKKIAAAKEERPVSHADKLAAASTDQQELASAAR